jgi:hypothetical protein
VGGTAVPLSRKLFNLLKDVYLDSDEECNIDIVFKSATGIQYNKCRKLITDYLSNPDLSTGLVIAERLRDHTDGRSGIGLLFLLSGQEPEGSKLVISRFPTNMAVLADESADKLSVSFLERVFMKSQYSYKAVRYSDLLTTNGFWTGRAVDKQNRGQVYASSDYWIGDFLDSSYRTTPAAGTKRLADLIRTAIDGASLDVKQEIIAAATLAPGLDGQQISVDGFIDKFSLSKEAAALIKASMKDPSVSKDNFVFTVSEYNKIIKYRSTELNNGAILTGPSSSFDEIFDQKEISDGRFRFSTEGEIVDERFRSRDR